MACNPHIQKLKPFKERFWEKVNKNGPVPPHMPHLGKCWVWTASLNTGYGQLRWPPKMQSTLAHRISWEIHHLVLGDEDCVLHRCDNRLCVNPNHLFLGTRDDNNKDKVSKGNQPRGEASGQAKLTSKEVLEIKTRIGKESDCAIARDYGVIGNTVRDIRLGITWGHLK